MELRTDSVQKICRAVSRQVRDYNRNLGLSFIVHRGGQRLESLAVAGQELLSHPAAEQALGILKSQSGTDDPDFMGLAAWRENILFGLATRQKMMALATMNIDLFENLRGVSLQAWHMAWHALALAGGQHDPVLEPQFAQGIVIPDRDEEDMAMANLKADTFSSVMCVLDGDNDAIRRLAALRCAQTLERHAGNRPGQYPFAIAQESVQLACNELLAKPPAKKKALAAAMALAAAIGETYDDLSVKQWLYFCKPAQDMAWRGTEKDIILGAAVSTSQDTYIRATGFLVAETIKITPASLLALEGIHSPFAEDKYNQRLHESMMERAFQKAVRAGMGNLGGAAFMEAANEQNEKMADGHILGWCAAALQAAGRAFDSAIARGSRAPEDDALREFKGTSARTTWETLRELGESILEQYRQGSATTFSDIIEFCGDRPAFAGVSSAVAFTMKDPAYLKKLDIANDLRAGPAPDMTPKAPAPAAAPAMTFPTLGRGAKQATTQRPPPQTGEEDEGSRKT